MGITNPTLKKSHTQSKTNRRSFALSAVSVCAECLELPLSSSMAKALLSTTSNTMPRFPRPCLECGVLTTNASRCDQHQVERSRVIEATRPKRKYKTKPKRLLYSGDYVKLAKKVRENATYCHLCGDGPRHNDPWTADHLIPGDPLSPLLAAHRSCNSRRGNKPLPGV